MKDHIVGRLTTAFQSNQIQCLHPKDNQCLLFSNTSISPSHHSHHTNYQRVGTSWLHRLSMPHTNIQYTIYIQYRVNQLVTSDVNAFSSMLHDPSGQMNKVHLTSESAYVNIPNVY